MRENNKIWKILIVDDDLLVPWCKHYERWIRGLAKEHKWTDFINEDYIHTDNGCSALEIFKADKDINLVISDVFMPPNCEPARGNPLDEDELFGGIWLTNELFKYVLTEECSMNGRDVRCLLVSDKRDSDKYVNRFKKMNKNLFDKKYIKFVDKPLDPTTTKNNLLVATYHALVDLTVINENRHNKKSNFITRNTLMKNLIELVIKAAPSNAEVLITGETGTGKEVVARLIHANSGREKHPFITINSNSLPETLVESELFGYEKGAFTGAESSKPGKFELANEGTLFLDEIGDMSLATQGKILRAIQEKEITRVGGVKSLEINVRLITATNKDLETLIKNGKFREDLFYRINVIHIDIPPLRNRKEDIRPFIDYFLDKFNYDYERKFSFSNGTINKILNYEFPGNVRELQNLIQRAVVLESEDQLLSRINIHGQTNRNVNNTALDLSPETIEIPENFDVRNYLLNIRELLIEAAIKKTRNMDEAAKMLGIPRDTLNNWKNKTKRKNG